MFWIKLSKLYFPRLNKSQNLPFAIKFVMQLEKSVVVFTNSTMLGQICLKTFLFYCRIQIPSSKMQLFESWLPTLNTNLKNIWNTNLNWIWCFPKAY